MGNKNKTLYLYLNFFSPKNHLYFPSFSDILKMDVRVGFNNGVVRGKSPQKWRMQCSLKI